jgi:predicted aldo/keto reductase-like oxidoreductase
MYYNDFKDIKLSGLGLGCMRFPVIEGDDSKIDIDAVREMVAYAMSNGINYYDTAWGYHGGTSETVMGEVLSEYDRSSFYLATKFPGYDRENFDKKEEIFEKQLEKCKTDYFDFYLLHTLTEENLEWYLDDELGLMDYLVEQKRPEE